MRFVCGGIAGRSGICLPRYRAVVTYWKGGERLAEQSDSMYDQLEMAKAGLEESICGNSNVTSVSNIAAYNFCGNSNVTPVFLPSRHRDGTGTVRLRPIPRAAATDHRDFGRPTTQATEQLE